MSSAFPLYSAREVSLPSMVFTLKSWTDMGVPPEARVLRASTAATRCMGTAPSGWWTTSAFINSDHGRRAPGRATVRRSPGPLAALAGDAGVPGGRPAADRDLVARRRERGRPGIRARLPAVPPRHHRVAGRRAV